MKQTLKNGTDRISENALLHRAIRKNYSAFFIKAIAHSIYHTPCINGFLDYTPLRNGGTFYLAEDINLSFTVNTKFGVIKPIIRNPASKTTGRSCQRNAPFVSESPQD